MFVSKVNQASFDVETAEITPDEARAFRQLQEAIDELKPMDRSINARNAMRMIEEALEVLVADKITAA